MWFLSTQCWWLDAPTKNQVFFQDPTSPFMDQVVEFHNDVLFLAVVIFIFVFLLVCKLFLVLSDMTAFSKDILTARYTFTHHRLLELIWTSLPMLCLLLIASPSLTLLYSTDNQDFDPSLTLRVSGHQWFWSYTYEAAPRFRRIHFDAYLIDEFSLRPGAFRLLLTDRLISLPVNHLVRVLITSADVLHSWTVPSLGIKVDACPGRLNQLFSVIFKEGQLFGQCSEICGVNHAFMPIVVRAEQHFFLPGWNTVTEHLSWDKAPTPRAALGNAQDLPALGYAVSAWSPFGIPMAMSIILVVSGGAVTVAHIALSVGDRARALRYFVLTVILAVIFMLVQLFEYVNLPFSINDGVFGSTFFMATGFHGFHVAVGSIFLLVCAARVERNEFLTKQHVGAEAAIWYWHFVDVVWLFLFLVVYCWSAPSIFIG